MIDNQEFLEFLREIAKKAKEAGIDQDKITSVIAAAISERERALGINTGGPTTSERQANVEPKQPIYGPPHESWTSVEVEPKQAIYGPPPIDPISRRHK